MYSIPWGIQSIDHRIVLKKQRILILSTVYDADLFVRTSDKEDVWIWFNEMTMIISDYLKDWMIGWSYSKMQEILDDFLVLNHDDFPNMEEHEVPL